jgi:hypothetical protein
MIILRVTMGSGLLKETVKEISTAVFAEQATSQELSRGVRMTIHKIEGPICGPGTSAASSDVSVSKHKGTAGVLSLV